MPVSAATLNSRHDAVRAIDPQDTQFLGWSGGGDDALQWRVVFDLGAVQFQRQLGLIVVQGRRNRRAWRFIAVNVGVQLAAQAAILRSSARVGNACAALAT